MRVLAIASGGGHWAELLRLRPALAAHDVAWATVPGAPADALGSAARVHRVPDVSRWDGLRIAGALAAVAGVILRVRPEAVISTGALPGLFGIALGKLLGCRTIWVDSLANVEQLSLSGRAAGLFADLWLAQWPELARPGGPRYEGAVL